MEMNTASTRDCVNAHLRLFTLGAALLLCVFIAGASQADTFIWNFNVPSDALSTPYDYLDTTSTYTLTAHGYTTEFASPLMANLGDMWNTGSVTPNDLYGKTSSPTEMGLGLDGLNPANEIQEDSFLQLDLSDLFAMGLNNLTMSVSSIQVGAGYYLWGSNTLGSPGALLKQGRNPADGGDEQTFVVPQYGAYRYISLSSTSHVAPQLASDVLLQNGMQAESHENDRRRNLPVTFTKDGWATFSQPRNPIITGGVVYNRFPTAFRGFTFKGIPAPNKLIVGGKFTISYTGTTSSLSRLSALFGQSYGFCSKLKRSLVSPYVLSNSDGGGGLAVETIALLMNVAYNDMRLMPRTPGYDLERFVLAKGPLARKTVGNVFNIANAILAGDTPSKYGLPDCATLVGILQQINANYEFVDYYIYNDRGYLIPNRPFGQPDPPRSTSVPMVCPP